MENPQSEPSDQTPITHFSHQHPLHLLDLQSLGQIPPCSACKLDAAGSVYTCTTCNFFLHPKCYQLPHQISHPFDPNHALILYPKPAYPEGLFQCDACGKQGGGFSYHCSKCSVDLHTTCASLPVQLSHHRHHHPLSLTFSVPYPGNSFSCDICKRISSKTWIYRCATCEFDVHVTCAATVVPRPSIIPVQANNHVNSPNVVGYGGPRPKPVVIGQAQNLFVGMPQTNITNNLDQRAGYGAVSPVNVLTSQLMVGAADGIASGVAQSTSQAIVQGFFDGGSGGGGVDDVSQVDVMGMGGGGATVDGSSYCDGGYGGYGASSDGSY